LLVPRAEKYTENVAFDQSMGGEQFTKRVSFDQAMVGRCRLNPV